MPGRHTEGVLRRLLIGVIVVAALFGGLLGALYALQRSLIYLPDHGPVPEASQVLPGGEDVTLHTSDGLRLSAWFFAAGPEHGEKRPAVLFAPGNAGNRLDRLPLARALTERGVSVLLLDYRGYAGNPGSPSEQGLARDVRAARDHLLDRPDVDSDRLLYFGESLGGGPLSELAVAHPPAGLLLRSPFVDLASVGRVHYPYLPVGALLKDRFPVADNVQRLAGTPLVVVYGSRDTVVPTEQSRQVALAGDAVSVEVPGADHNDAVLAYGEEVIAATVRLARTATR